MTTSRTRQQPRWESDRYEDDYDEPPRTGRRAPSGPGGARRFGLPVVAAALVGGLFVGYIVSSGGGGTATVTETKTVTAPASATAPGATAASGAATRGSIRLAVLNGSEQSGLARSTADTAEGLGYQNVTAADAPAPVATTEVVYREGYAAQAQQVADDLQLAAPQPATVGSGVLAVAPDAQVVVVLGASAATGTGAATDSGASTDAGTATAPATADGTTPTQ